MPEMWRIYRNRKPRQMKKFTNIRTMPHNRSGGLNSKTLINRYMSNNSESQLNNQSQPDGCNVLSAVWFESLGFYECSPSPMYKLMLPTEGTYLLSNAEGSLWIEYEEAGESYKQSVGFGKFEPCNISALVALLLNCR